MHSAAERVNILVLSLIALGIGIYALDHALNQLNQPAIAVSMLIVGGAVAVMGWAWTLPARRRHR